MNNNAPAILRTLITYAICVPLAVIVGYLSTWAAYAPSASNFSVFGLLALLLVFPLLLRWHYPLLLFSWTCSATVFFIKGGTSLWLMTVVLSLGISVVERILNPHRQFIRVPQITVPLMALVIVVFITAKLNGGIGLHSMGSDVYGGKKYIFLFIGIASYFALTAKRIPPEQAQLYVTLFFVGGATTCIGDLYPITPSVFKFIFLIFPPAAPTEGFEFGVTRLGGIANGAFYLFLLMLARYGVKGIFLGGKLWRPAATVALVYLSFMGGFRTTIFMEMLAFGFMFYVEGLHRTKLLGLFLFLGLFGSALVVPLAHRLPFTFQRALTFLPLDLDPMAREAADSSTNWRMAMWKATLPQVPDRIWLGKGYAITVADYESGIESGIRGVDVGQASYALAGDYHNGMLSVIMAFGIWGVIIIVWFFVAALRIMYLNYKHGRPDLHLINALLFILFLNQAVGYLSCLGGLSLASDIRYFIGFLGLSIALNHGVCRPPPKPVPVPVGTPRLAPVVPAFQR